MGRHRKVPASLPLALPESRWRERFRRRLTVWYKKHARDLPWRRSSDPYLVWVSEIMLQQTQVATVEPYFLRFREAFPTIQSLAGADEQAVLRLWEGLGYYRRARQLHAAARIIVEKHGGKFPREFEQVLALPGIGRYTAGAIMSIALEARVPILEANTLRLFSRLLAYRGRPASTEGNRLLWAMAEAVLPRKDVGSFNQALMELGSEICTPRDPKCDCCPVAGLCGAKGAGIEQQIPTAGPKKTVEQVHEVALIVRRRGRVLLLRRPDGGRWAGLWDFPRYEMDHDEEPVLLRKVQDRLRRQTGIDAQMQRHLERLRHGVTRFRIVLDCYTAEYLAAGSPPADVPELKWVAPKALADYPLSTTGRKLAQILQKE